MLIRVLRYRGRAPDVVTEAEFTEAGGTIGRSPECTLMLPDPERHISRVQAEIRWSGREFMLLERGTANPIERNGELLIAGQSVVLCDGDELHIGDYVLRIEFQQTKTVVRSKQAGIGQLEEADASDMKTAFAGSNRFGTGRSPGPGATQPDFTKRDDVPVSIKEKPTSPGARMPADAGEAEHRFRFSATHPASDTAFRSWDNPEGITQTVIIGRSEPRPTPAAEKAGEAQAPQPPQPPVTSQETAAPAEQRESANQQDPTPKIRTTGFLQDLNRKVLDAKQTATAPAGHAPPELWQALLSGAGVPDLPHKELDEETMRRIGSLLRSFAQGIVDLLTARAELKAEMRAEMTIITSEGNNPLKLSPDAATALSHLLSPYTTRSFMQPEAAVQDAVSDLIAHQAAVICGMHSALRGLLQRLSPQALEQRLAGRSVLDTMLPMNRKAKLWELFEEIFADVSQEAQDDFASLSSHEFVKAYEAQVKRLEARDR